MITYADHYQDVPPYSVVVGNPARVIKQAPRETKLDVTSGALAALQRDEASQKKN